ncbi:MAG TPA: lipopolysaccharide biosynthesis protein [Pyrinomonadaceae bacterium]|jgi:PST family polysaccharide transporter
MTEETNIVGRAAGAETPSRAPAGGDAGGGLGRRAVQGVLWTYVSFAGSKLLVFASTVILARLLVPAEFGQVGFALLVISYLDTVGDFGVSSALIYERERPEEAADVSFVISLLTGLLWFAAAYAGAPLVAEFFDDPGVVSILRVTALVFVINALGNTHDALLRRDLEFKKRLAPDFAMALIKGGCSVGLAMAGWGVWSLVWGQLIGTAASTVALWLVVPWRPRWHTSWRTARGMLSYGGKIVSVNVVSAVVHDADFVIVGRVLGGAALGLYSLAYRTPEFFITMIIWVIGKVTFPVYAKLRDDPPALRQAFLLTLRYLSLITLPAGLGLAALGGLFVPAFYGEHWEAATATLQALAVAGALRSLGSHAGDVYKATGRPGILTKLGILRAAVLVPSMWWGARYGILGVALAQLVVTLGSTLLNLYVAGRVLKLSAWSLLAEFKTAALGSCAMVSALLLLLPLLAGLPKWAGLTAGVVAGAAVYALAAWVVGRETVEQARTTVLTSLRRAA